MEVTKYSEQLYQHLSDGVINSPIGGSQLHPFAMEMQKLMHKKSKRIVLEKPPVDTPSLPNIWELVEHDLDGAIRIYLTSMEAYADSIRMRDGELIDKIIIPKLANGRRPFTFRGLAHECYFRQLAQMRSITPICISYSVKRQRDG